MKVIVRGKSVDLQNREGSSPSIPNPQPPLTPYLFFSYPLFFKIDYGHPILLDLTSV